MSSAPVPSASPDPPPSLRRREKRWLALLPLIAGVLWLGAAPSQATGESWIVTGVHAVGCGSGNWQLGVNFSGLDGGSYVAHTRVTAGGKVYMSEGDYYVPVNGDDVWSLFHNFDYGAVDNPGDFPIPAGLQMQVTFSLERPKGTVLSSWTLIAPSCDSADLLYNGPTSDLGEHSPGSSTTDQCPTLEADTPTGCPVRDRSLTLRAKYGPRRVVGRLYAAGYPALYAGRTVSIWKVRPGPDRLIAIRATNDVGGFKLRVGRGRFYATSPDVLIPSSGEAAADTSGRVRVR